MGRYPAEALDMKFAWMRAKQRKKAEKEARKAQRPAELPVLLRAAPEPLQQHLRVPEVAKSLGVSQKTVREWFRKRAVVVPAGRSRAIMLIPRLAVDEWIREHMSR